MSDAQPIHVVVAGEPPRDASADGAPGRGMGASSDGAGRAEAGFEARVRQIYRRMGDASRKAQRFEDLYSSSESENARLRSLMAQMGYLAERQEHTERVLLGESAARQRASVLETLDSSIAQAQERLTKALEEGDTAAAAAANGDLIQAHLRRRQVTPAAPGGGPGPAAGAPQPRPQRRLDPLLQSWVQDNGDWWGRDPVMTQHAQRLYEEMKAAGQSIGDRGYYNALDGSMRLAFPDFFGVDPQEMQRRFKLDDGPPPLAGDEGRRPPTGHSGQGAITVKLTPRHVEIAQLQGLTAEQWARGKLAAQAKGLIGQRA